MTDTTPRPLRIIETDYGPIRVVDANGNRFCEIACAMAMTAHDIVTAVNAHDDLVKALEAFLEWNEAEEHQSPVWATGERKRPDFWERVEMFGVARDFARSALAKSKGEKT